MCRIVFSQSTADGDVFSSFSFLLKEKIIFSSLLISKASSIFFSIISDEKYLFKFRETDCP